MSEWQQTAPTSSLHSPTHQSRWGGGTAYSPPRPSRRAEGSAHRTPPPVFNPGSTPHLPEAAELVGEGPGGTGGVRVGAGAVAAARCAQSAPTRASPPTTPLQRALSPRPTSEANPDTSNATAPTRINRHTTTAVTG